MASILSQMNPVHIPHTISSYYKTLFNISPINISVFLVVSFLLVFPLKPREWHLWFYKMLVNSIAAELLLTRPRGVSRMKFKALN
jgi:hypothetical protein